MKNVLLFTAFLMLVASIVFAQAGSIGVFADTEGLNCDLNNEAGYMNVYCVHVNSAGAMGCEFKLQLVGAPLTWVGESNPFGIPWGNTQIGVSITYGECLVSPVLATTVTYMGTSLACDMLHVVAHPDTDPPGIYVLDCAVPTPNLLVATGGSGYINNDGSCPCDIPTEETSWGQIKSLYQK